MFVPQLWRCLQKLAPVTAASSGLTSSTQSKTKGCVLCVCVGCACLEGRVKRFRVRLNPSGFKRFSICAFLCCVFSLKLFNFFCRVLFPRSLLLLLSLRYLFSHSLCDCSFSCLYATCQETHCLFRLMTVMMSSREEI